MWTRASVNTLLLPVRDYPLLNVGIGGSVWNYLTFGYAVRVMMLAYNSTQFETADLPILPGKLRSTFLYASMKGPLRTVRAGFGPWKPKVGSGWNIVYAIIYHNAFYLSLCVILSAISGGLFYTPFWALSLLLEYVESDPERRDIRWGLVYALLLFLAHNVSVLGTYQPATWFRTQLADFSLLRRQSATKRSQSYLPTSKTASGCN